MFFQKNDRERIFFRILGLRSKSLRTSEKIFYKCLSSKKCNPQLKSIPPNSCY